MMKTVFTTSILLTILTLGFSQGKPAGTEDEYDKTYKWRIRQQNLYGVYIPADIGEVFHQLNSLSEKNDRDKFKALTETQAARVPFFSLGRWMSLNWGFYGGSRLTVYLNQLGLYHPDDMTRFLLIMYNRHLKKAGLNPKEVIEGMIEARKEYDLKKKLEGEVLSEEIKIRERPSGEGGF